ncbi:MAG: FprA family A-type flavoprotein [Clostridia bacterium]|nr:FprA family A-type flavoprotein [Clostridia bacterium]
METDIKRIGVNDRNIRIFEGQYNVSNGMSYNSYVIMDEKIAVFDTVETAFKDEWLENLRGVLNGKQPDYLIIQHMEPDHSANISAFLEAYPDVKMVASKKSFLMMKNFFGKEFLNEQIVVEDGTFLSLGNHELLFFTAPMVHWPEVIVTYDKKEKVLFSADGFGKFGTTDTDEDWLDEARRYYFGIVGKYGVQVQTLLKKLSDLDIRAIYPLHGPILTESISHYLKCYDSWSKYEAETKGVLIAFTSVYGNTKQAVQHLAERLKENGCEKVMIVDLATIDMSTAIANAFRFDKIVLATTTYNGEIFPFMREFIHGLMERNFQNRTVGFIENGSWAPMATRVMKDLLEKSKNLQYLESSVKILSAMTEENYAQIDALAKELCKD